MANIKNAVYQALGENESLDTSYHFETNVGMTKILDKNKNEVGNVEQALFTGKVLDNVDWRTLKVKGSYSITNIKNVTGVTISADKRHILLVDPIGEIGNPTFIIYKLYTPVGEIFDNVIVNGTEVGWTIGGKSSKAYQEEINNQISLLGSELEELGERSSEANLKLNGLEEDFITYKGHNHDDKYLKLSGGDITGQLSIKNNTNVSIKNSANANKVVAHVSTTDLFTLGNTSYGLNLVGNGDFKYNNTKVWTESNDGKGSGLDADLLGGKSHTKYAALDANNVFEGNLQTKGYLWSDNYWIGEKALISSLSNGKVTLSTGGANKFNFEPSGSLNMQGYINLNSKNNEVGLSFSVDDNDAGAGIYRNKNTKHLGFYNWKNNENMAYFDTDTSVFHMNKAPSITGRRLYLQNGTPAGNHQAGDIWIK